MILFRSLGLVCVCVTLFLHFIIRNRFMSLRQLFFFLSAHGDVKKQPTSVCSTCYILCRTVLKVGFLPMEKKKKENCEKSDILNL